MSKMKESRNARRSRFSRGLRSPFLLDRLDERPYLSNTFWTGTANDLNFFNPANWTLNQAPAGGRNAVFDSSHATPNGTIIINSDFQSIDDIVVDGVPVNLDLNGNTSFLISKLTITNGGWLTLDSTNLGVMQATGDVSVAANVGDSGELEIMGAAVLYTGPLFVATSGGSDATLNISEYGSLSTAFSDIYFGSGETEEGTGDAHISIVGTHASLSHSNADAYVTGAGDITIDGGHWEGYTNNISVSGPRVTMIHDGTMHGSTISISLSTLSLDGTLAADEISIGDVNISGAGFFEGHVYGSGTINFQSGNAEDDIASLHVMGDLDLSNATSNFVLYVTAGLRTNAVLVSGIATLGDVNYVSIYASSQGGPSGIGEDDPIALIVATYTDGPGGYPTVDTEIDINYGDVWGPTNAVNAGFDWESWDVDWDYLGTGYQSAWVLTLAGPP